MNKKRATKIALASTVAIGIAASAIVVYKHIREPACGDVAESILSRVQSVIPAHFRWNDNGDAIGDENWMKFGASWKKDSVGTSCGLLVGWGLEPWVNTRYGLQSMREEAKRLGLWIEAKPGLTPCPGSAFLLERDNAGLREIMHVGFIKKWGNKQVITLDAGQDKKPEQSAIEVVRNVRVDGQNIILSAFGEHRILAGWLDSGLLSKAVKEGRVRAKNGKEISKSR